jgi:hypothetical protein
MNIDLMQDFSFKHSDETGNSMNVGDPTSVKAKLDSQAVELRNYIIGLVNLLNSLNGADYISAKGFDGLKTTIQAMLNDLNSRKLDQWSDFKGSWFGITNPAYAEPGIANVVASHTEQLNDMSKGIVYLSKYLNDKTNTEALQDAINDTPRYGKLIIEIILV